MQVNYDLTVLNPEIMLIGSHEKNCMSKSRPAPFYFFFQIKPFKKQVLYSAFTSYPPPVKNGFKAIYDFQPFAQKKNVSDSDLMDLLEVK